MNVLIVYAHPEPESFVGKMKITAIDVLKKQGHQVQISDLYDLNFKATADYDDFLSPLGSGIFDLHAEQLHASRTNSFSADIIAEQHKLLWSHFILFIFPLWWYSLPAILKGWIDRVFANGFAYGESYRLAGRRAMLCISTGGEPKPFTRDKQVIITGITDHIQRGTLHFCGIDVLPPYAAYGGDYATSEQRKEYLAQFSQMIASLSTVTPINYNDSL